MARQRTAFRSSKSIAGAALVGFGIFILYANLAGAVAWLTHLLGADSSQAVGVLPVLIVAVSQLSQADAANHQRFLQDFLQPILLISWPLLLVMAGTVLLRNTFTHNVHALAKENCGVVDLTAGRSTLKQKSDDLRFNKER
ncbi:MAG: hypothetical protein ACR2JE_05985 [Acidobacteriaceae bacterium]